MVEKNIIMKTLINRKFIVNATLNTAFDHLAQVEKWPSWARHIRRVELNPPDSVTAVTQGTLTLTNGVKTQFQMTHFDPPPFLGVGGQILMAGRCL